MIKGAIDDHHIPSLFEPDRLPDDDSATAKAFRKWWEKR